MKSFYGYRIKLKAEVLQLMKIATLTLNPAVDRTMYCGIAKIGALNRAVAPSMMIHGGKGTNVSCALKQFGAESTAYGFIGGEMGDLFLKLLEPYGIDINFTRTESESRLNFKVISENGAATEFNEAGGEIKPSEKEELLEKIKNNLNNIDLFIMGGSVPPGAGKGIYGDIINLGGGKTKFIADCDGEALKLCMSGAKKPYIIKPNQFELEQYVGKKFDLKNNFNEELKKIKQELIRIYIETGVIILCTLGEYGGIYCGPEGLSYIRSPKVEVKGFTGAGDTFLTAFAAVYFGMFDKLPMKLYSPEATALAFAVAASTAKVTKPGTEFASLDEITEMYKRITENI